MMKRFCALLLAIILSFAGISLMHASADRIGNEQPPKVIAVVFDNSSSMYDHYSRDAWCRATYALQVFAAMMNEQDKMMVYPMHTVTVNGERYSMQKPLIINSPQEAKLIRDIYTPNPGNTPVTTIEKALEGLEKESAEKWLVILTDGVFGYPDSSYTIPIDEFSGMCTKYVKQHEDVRFLYLAIGDSVQTPVVSSDRFFADKAESSKEILSKLTSMCNLIFGRDVLDNVGDTVQFDVSMKKLFIFAQGKDITNVSLTDSSGNSVGKKIGDDISTQYSVNKSNYGVIDYSLQGMIVTYQDCKAGSYNLQYQGNASNVSVYYEPDVSLAVFLVDGEGNRIGANEFPCAGRYKLQYGLIDNQTGDTEFTHAKELKNAHYEISYTINGNKTVSTCDNLSGEEWLDLNAGDILNDFNIKVTYLSGYELTRTGRQLGWPDSGFRFDSKDPGKLEIRVSGGQNVYHLSQLNSEEPFRVELWYNDEQLVQENLRSAVMESTDANGIRIRITPEKDHYEIIPDYVDPAHPENTLCGEMTVNFVASYTEPAHDTAYAETALTFTIEDDTTALRAAIRCTRERLALTQITSSPVYIDLLLGSDRLTEADMDRISWDITINGEQGSIPFTVEKDPYQSRLVLNLQAEGVRKGDYTVSAKVSGMDKLGQEMTALDSAELHVRLLPNWLLILIIALAVLAAAGLIAFILTRKVLPTKADIEILRFRLGTHDQIVMPDISFTGKFSKTGNLTFSHPTLAAAPNASCGFSMDLEACDTVAAVLMNKIFKNRSLSVIRTTITADPAVQSITMGGIGVRFQNGTPVYPQGITPPTPTISSGANATISGRADNRSVSLMLRITFS